jgi:hypothetical protein
MKNTKSNAAESAPAKKEFERINALIKSTPKGCRIENAHDDEGNEWYVLVYLSAFSRSNGVLRQKFWDLETLEANYEPMCN